MNKSQRVSAVLEGRPADRPPVSFWYHFAPDCIAGPSAVEAHVRHVETYDLDFLKIMNDGRYPFGALGAGGIEDAGDLDKLTVLNGDEDDFGRQLEVIGTLAGRFAGEIPMTTTIFNAWSTLRRMTAAENNVHKPPALGPSTEPAQCRHGAVVGEAPFAMARALDTVAQSLANFAAIASPPAPTACTSPSGRIGSTRRTAVAARTLAWCGRAIFRSSPRPPRHLQHVARLRHGTRFPGLCRLSRAGDQLGRSFGWAADRRGCPLGPARPLCRPGQSWNDGQRFAGRLCQGGNGCGGRGRGSAHFDLARVYFRSAESSGGESSRDPPGGPRIILFAPAELLLRFGVGWGDSSSVPGRPQLTVGVRPGYPRRNSPNPNLFSEGVLSC